MIIRIDAAAKFVMDAFVIVFIAIILTDEIWHSLLLFWPLISLGGALSTLLLVKKYSYKLWQTIALAAVSGGAGLLIGLPWWLAAALMLASIYRMHARFSENEDEAGRLGTPLLWVVGIFIIALMAALFNPHQETERILYLLFIAAVVLNVLFSLAYQYIKHRSEGIVLSHLTAAAGIVLTSAGLIALFVFGVAQTVRQGVGMAAGWLLHLALWPFSGLMEKMGSILSNLSRSKEAQETFEKLGPEETSGESELIEFQAAVDFPVEAMVTIVLLIFAIILFVWLKKRYPENTALEQTQAVNIERAAVINSESVIKETMHNNVHTEEIDLHYIRAVYRDFERKAEVSGYGRGSSETVREWMARLGWHVSDEFFSTYEHVRYGQGTVAVKEATPFLEEVEELTKRNF